LPLEDFVANGHVLFVRTLGIVDVLRPQVFQSPEAPELLELLLGPLDAAATQGSHPICQQLEALATQFGDFVAHAAAPHLNLLVPHQDALDRIANVWPALRKLPQLLREPAQSSSVHRRPQDLLPSSQIATVRAKLRAALEGGDWHGELHHTLEDIRQASLQEIFLEELLALTASSSSIASLVYTLLGQMLYVSPKHTERVVMDVLTNLQSSKPHVQRTAQEAVTLLYRHAWQYREELLMALFNGGEQAMPTLREILVGETV